MGATLQDSRDVFRKLTNLLSDTRSDESTVTRAIVIEGGIGVGKSYVLREAVDIVREFGFHWVGPIDGRDMTAHTTCWRRFSQEPELIADSQLPAADTGVPVLVAVDNAHLADPDRLRLEMRLLSRRYRSSSIWMITARTLSRPAALAADEVVYESLADLPEDVVIELVTEVLCAPPSATLLEFVAQAGGNPQLITELIVGLREEGALHLVDGQVRALHTKIPKRVRRMVGHRLNELSPRCRQMLQVAAVVGREVSVATIADFTAEPVANLLPLLEEASDAGLVPSDGPHLAFRNTLLWQAVHASVPIYVREIISQEAMHPDDGRPQLDSTWDSLGEKERTIAQLAGEGLTNQQIARRVYLSPHTVNYYLRHVFRKLEVASRIELAKLLVARG